MEIMRKFFLCLAVVSGAWIGLGAQKRADQQHLIDPESFSMILLGDPQGYVKYDINQPLFELIIYFYLLCVAIVLVVS